MHRWRCYPIALLACLASQAGAQTSSTGAPPPAPPPASAEPAIKLPPDQAAYKAANALQDPQQRAAALQRFTHDFPDSKRAHAARRSLLELSLKQHSSPKQSHTLAKDLLKHAGHNLASDENDVAYMLAMAPGKGVDLSSAEHWSKDSLKRLTLASVGADMRASNAEFKEPPPSASDVQKFFNENRASYLQTLAEIQFRRGKLDDASHTLTEALALEPNMGAGYSTRAEIAQARHNDTEALQDLESAELYGGISREDAATMARLYAAQHHGSTDGLAAEIDKQYLAAFPSVAPPARSAPPTAVRSVLVELFTGSGCHPCAAADLALEDLLKSYPSSEVIGLALDQHIPLPDPLTNPSTVARAEFDDLHYTPTVRVDGRQVEIRAGDRAEASPVYKTLAAAIDTDLTQPSGISLHLAVQNPSPQSIQASVAIQVTDPAAVQKLLSGPSLVEKPKQTAGEHDHTTPLKLVANFALVEREIRYSGENGIRFHQNVVRNLARPSAQAFPVDLTGSSEASVTFDLPSISAGLAAYLTDFSKKWDGLSETTFLQTDTALPPADLAVAAWVEDPITHLVLAAAIQPVTGATAVQQASR